MADDLKNCRTRVFVDNRALYDGWQRQGTKSTTLNDVIKSIAQLGVSHNMALTLDYIPSAENPADKPSRRLSKSDSTLTSLAWCRVQQFCGGPSGHTIDLMALDANAECDANLQPLRHFTPVPSPKSLGCDVFAQKLQVGENYYVFPPCGLIGPVLVFLLDQCIPFTFVCPITRPAQWWVPTLITQTQKSCILGAVGEMGILSYPSKKGFRADEKGLPWDLWVSRVAPDVQSGHNQFLRFYDAPKTIIIGDSMVRFLSQAPWAEAGLQIVSIGGATLLRIKEEVSTILQLEESQIPRFLCVHAGTNNVNKGNMTMEKWGDCAEQLNILCEILARVQQERGVTIVVSALIHTKSPETNKWVDKLNGMWVATCRSRFWYFLDHSNIMKSSLADCVHLNGEGKIQF